MEVHSMRLDHGSIQTNNMPYSQRQPPNHRPNHSAQATAHVSAELYKPSRSPLSNTRCTYPGSPQLQPTPTNVTQVQVSQRYTTQGPTTTSGPPSLIHSPVYHRPQPDYRHPNRISLLHPEYGPGGRRDMAGGAMGQPLQQLGEQPFKKIRLTDKDVQPLRIDTRPGTYHPQTEAISPILPEQVSQEDQAFKTTKDDLIQQISKVDREILKVEQQIVILKKKQAELEEVANKPPVNSEVEEETRPQHQSLPQKIYAENRKKAQNAHAQLDSLGPKVEWPLYNQPTDTTVFHENNRRNVMFKKRLLEYFKKKHTERYARHNQLTGTYSKLMQEWLRKVDKIESSTKRKVKEAKNREFFEKVFPELRKQREDKERFNRVGARVKSEADMEEIMDNLQEQALEDKKMRSYAVIPPILLDPKERRKYTNNNNFIEDMEVVYKSRQYLNIWTPAEKETFKEKFIQHPKNFYQISQALGERKSVSECVHFYYLSKKTENYKQLLRKNKRDKFRERMKASRQNHQNVNNSANLPIVDTLTTGVTTRLQREQQQRTGGAARTAEAPTAAAAAVTADAANSGNSNSPPIPLGTTATPSPRNAGGTTTTNTVTSCASGTLTSTSTALTGDWMNTKSSVSQVSSSSILATATSSVISISVASSLSSTLTTLTNTTSTTNSSGFAPTTMDTSSAGEEGLKDDKSVVKFNDFNSFEDYNNRKKFFGDNSNPLTDPSSEKDGERLNMEQKDRGSQFGKDDPENANGTNEANCENTASTPTPESKKKKERRKDKDNAVETSDEEAASLQDKTIQGSCIVCNEQLGPQLHSRPLQPSQASQYGLREDEVPLNSRVCNTCRCKCVRSRYTHCPLPTCPNARGRVKRLRSFPYRLQDLPSDVKDPILAEFRIPSGVTKCCSACFNRIQRRLGPVEEWPEEEVTQLKTALTELGANWQLIGERLNKLAHQVRSFYAANRKRLSLENCLGDRKPTLTDEEESGSSTSSCEEPIRDRERHSSDTTSAAESPPVLQGQNQNAVKKEDYDSSATETADEAQTPDHYQTATITPVTNDYQPRPAPSPLSVKELVMNVIEISLNKNAGAQQTGQIQGSGMAPTISSILNNDSNEVTIVSEYTLPSNANRSQPPLQSRADISLTKLANTIGATITPVSGPIRSQPQPEPIQSSRDDLVVVQIPDIRDSIPETLDLSIKKPREPIPPTHSKHPPSNIHRSEPSYIYHPERKSPAHIRTSHVKLPSPQPANPKGGSITLGTPIINQPTRYDGLLRQIPDAKMGSITKGTPIHTSHNLQQDKRVYEYFAKQGRMPSQQNMTAQSQYHYPQRSPYDQQVSSQMTSRQIIIDDYITSQQMLSRRQDKPQYYPANSPHRTPPPQQSQQRQGVIQRHTRPQYHPPPGHEALSSLVDIAVQQPSLPVPSAPHEGLGKTIADNIMEQPHRFQIIQQHQQQMRQQQQRIDEQRRAYHQQQQQVRPQPRSDPSTMTAASLIDAIITHQINQTAEGGRGDVVSNAREPPRAGDLLFQSFQRDPPVSQDNNGIRPPSVINLDLDNEGVNKNLTVKELTDSVISHDFSTRPGAYYHMQENVNEQWKRRLQQQQQKEENKRSATPLQQVQQQQDERQIIRIAQPQKYHHEPISPPENNHWSEQNFRRYQQPQSHMSPLDYVKNRIVEVMRTEDDKKDIQDQHVHEKDRSDSPGDMVIDEEKHENDFSNPQQDAQHQQTRPTHQQPQGAYSYSYVHKDNSNDSSRNNEPKPLLSAQYEPLSDED
ncbi:nuclear receptor corepressor 1 isoform X1 [Sitophilus oryzae]|uniref:Nuclear receptor corepressor 1 isoform X1 n=2 Tax=Sitophilus oryzae TaxID=7048 RepID=A0A6J2X8T8_SITOR|nr:nuclear receptor corepressor 1 isoform X1 [Sitophilus oryzae]